MYLILPIILFVFIPLYIVTLKKLILFVEKFDEKHKNFKRDLTNRIKEEHKNQLAVFKQQQWTNSRLPNLKVETRNGSVDALTERLQKIDPRSPWDRRNATIITRPPVIFQYIIRLFIKWRNK